MQNLAVALLEEKVSREVSKKLRSIIHSMSDLTEEMSKAERLDAVKLILGMIKSGATAFVTKMEERISKQEKD